MTMTNIVRLNQTQIIKEVTDRKIDLIAVDTETYFNPLNKDAVYREIKGALNNEPFCVPVYFEHEGKGYASYITDMFTARRLLSIDSIEKIFHNFKYDYNMLLNIGIKVKGKIHDTMIMINLINEEFECKMPLKDDNGVHTKKKSKKLKDLAYHFLGEESHHSEMAVKDARMEIARERNCSISDISYKDVADSRPEIMEEYAIFDTVYTYKLYMKFLKGIATQRLYRAMETDIEVTKAIIDIERQGIKLDLDSIKRDLEVLKDKMTVIEEDIKRVAGNDEVNLNSNRETADMFEQLGVNWRWLTPTGEYNTSKDVLKTIKDEYSTQDGITYIVDALLKYRKIEKIVSTYLENKESEIQNDGKVHPSYWVIGNDYGVGGTVTGRLSSSNPNMQNIPKGDIEIDGVKYNMRKYFIADDDYVVVSMDAD